MICRNVRKLSPYQKAALVPSVPNSLMTTRSATATTALANGPASAMRRWGDAENCLVRR